ncbi:MAG: VOC family protein, partial [Actinobacteria bacterium]|nr:VOC family protein [Actinomycetota bacterium]
MANLGMITLLVDDYDQAIDYYTNVLGFTLVEDTPLSDIKRWVVVSPGEGAHLLLAKATDEAQAAAIGNQTGGRVSFFLYTDNCPLLGAGNRFGRQGVVYEIGD